MNEPLSKEELERIKALCERATAGPWVAELTEPFTLGGDYREVVALDADGMVTRNICNFMLDTDEHPSGESFLEDKANAELLAECRTALPQCLTEIKRLKGLIETLALTHCTKEIVPEFVEGQLDKLREALMRLKAELAEARKDKERLEIGLDLKTLRAKNIERQTIWCSTGKPDLSFRGVELAGETGEACNVIKKLERERHGWRGSRATKDQLEEELADVVIVADLIAEEAGIDLSDGIVKKFNKTSNAVNIPVFIDAAMKATPQ